LTRYQLYDTNTSYRLITPSRRVGDLKFQSQFFFWKTFNMVDSSSEHGKAEPVNDYMARMDMLFEMNDEQELF
jgi:hypothetical protein